MEVLTGDGRVVVARPDNEHADLFHGFPNSYGTLGYALRLTIDLEPVRPFVRLRHLRFATAEACLAAMADACAAGAHDGEPVDFVDGTVFGPDEQYLTLGTFVDEAPTVSDYTGMDIYYRSIQRARGRPPDGARLPVALGHRLVLVLARVRGAAARWCAGCGRAATAAPTCTAGSSPSTAGTGSAHRVARLRGQPRRSRWSRTSRCRSGGRPSSSTCSTARSASRPVWLCPLRLRARRPGRCTR